MSLRFSFQLHPIQSNLIGTTMHPFVFLYRQKSVQTTHRHHRTNLAIRVVLGLRWDWLDMQSVRASCVLRLTDGHMRPASPASHSLPAARQEVGAMYDVRVGAKIRSV
jgi:hypothetical protein